MNRDYFFSLSPFHTGAYERLARPGPKSPPGYISSMERCPGTLQINSYENYEQGRKLLGLQSRRNAKIRRMLYSSFEFFVRMTARVIINVSLWSTSCGCCSSRAQRLRLRLETGVREHLRYRGRAGADAQVSARGWGGSSGTSWNSTKPLVAFPTAMVAASPATHLGGTHEGTKKPKLTAKQRTMILKDAKRELASYKYAYAQLSRHGTLAVYFRRKGQEPIRIRTRWTHCLQGHP